MSIPGMLCWLMPGLADDSNFDGGLCGMLMPGIVEWSLWCMASGIARAFTFGAGCFDTRALAVGLLEVGLAECLLEAGAFRAGIGMPFMSMPYISMPCIPCAPATAGRARSAAVQVNSAVWRSIMPPLHAAGR